MQIPLLHQPLSEEHLRLLKVFSTSCRKSIIEMVTNAQSGHPGGSLSSIDYLTLLYTFRISQTGERVVVSNGHISPAVYAVLAEMGYIPKDEVIKTFRRVGSIYEGHVTRHVPGVHYGTGPLGIGVSVASGFAHAAKLRNSQEKVFALLGDGEAEEGQVYEMMHYAKKYQLNNLILFVDANRIQLSGPLAEVMPIDLPHIFASAHFRVIEVDGHDFQDLWSALQKALSVGDCPAVIIGKTLMGKGIDFMEKDSIENTYNWHGIAPSREQAEKALLQLKLSSEDMVLLDTFRREHIRLRPLAPFSAEDALPPIQTGKGIILNAGVKTDCRSAYGNALKDLAHLNPHIVALTADLGGSVKTDTMKKSHPDRVFDVGIAEQHMVSTAGGFSLAGFVPFCSTFGAFMTSRAKDQARVNDINRTNVKMVATHCGLSVGEDGPTHQSLDDLGSFLGFFNTALLEPVDPNHCDHMIRYIARTYGNFYVRMGRAKASIITKEDGSPFFDEQYHFELGKSDLMQEGKDLTLLAAGTLLSSALEVARKLKPQISIEVISLPSLSHLDRELLNKSLHKTKKVLTLEDHNLKNGYATQIAAFIGEIGLAVQMDHMGVAEYQLSGTAEELYLKAGLSPMDIEKRVLRLYSSK